MHKGGRSRATTVLEDRKIKQFYTKYPKAVPREVKNEIRTDSSLSTIKRRPREYGLRNYRCTKKPYVSEKTEKLALILPKHIWTGINNNGKICCGLMNLNSICENQMEE